MEWEALSSVIANTILGLDNIVGYCENMNLLTLNRLCLRRSNDCSPAATMEVTGNLDKLLKENKMIFNLLFQEWLVSYTPKLLNHPKRFCPDCDIELYDVVLFLKQDGVLSNNYQYGIGMINKIVPRKGSVIWKTVICYRNQQEYVNE